MASDPDRTERPPLQQAREATAIAEAASAAGGKVVGIAAISLAALRLRFASHRISVQRKSP